MARSVRRLVAGVVGLLAVWVGLAWSGASSSATDGSWVVDGGVSATGAGALPAGWTVAHPFPGYYVLRAPVPSPDLDVRTWDTAGAEVAIAPIGGGAVEVRFLLDGQPVDSRFTWRALVPD